MHPSHLIVTDPSGPPSRDQASLYRILRGLRVRGDDPNVPPVIFGGILEEGTYPLPRRILQGRMIGEIIRSQVPNKVLWAVHPPVDPAEQLLPRSNRCALSQLHTGNCSRLVTYRHSDPTYPDSHATDHMVAYLFSCPAHPTDLALGDM